MKTLIPGKSVCGICLVLALAFWPVPHTLAATITVSTTNDNGAGSLRQAIQTAAPGDTIEFSVTGAITLMNGELAIATNLTIVGPGHASLTVLRSTASNTPPFRIFNITGGTVSISGLTIANGAVYGSTGTNGVGSDGGVGQAAQGGSVFNRSSLSLSNCVVRGNSVTGGNAGQAFGGAGIGAAGGEASGGGIYNEGALELIRCDVRDNRATGGGGGYASTAGAGGSANGAGIWSRGALNVIQCSVRDNQAIGGTGGYPFGGSGGNGSGGGIYNQGSLTLNGATVSGNLTQGGLGGARDGRGGFSSGGGIANDNGLVATNCTFSGNSARGGDSACGSFSFRVVTGSEGGGIASTGALTLVNCTISGNNVSPGGTDGCFPSSNGGISVGGGISSSGTLLKNTIIAGNHENELNPGSPDVAGRVTSQGYNLIGLIVSTDGLVAGDLAGSVSFAYAPLDPKLGPLQDNGGSTLTIALLPGSPAINAGDSSACPATDQRGVSRPQGARCDIGAYESALSSGGTILSPAGTIERLPEDQLRIEFPTLPSRFYLLQASADLIHWTSVIPNFQPDGVVRFQETNSAQFPARFFRMVTR
ncbi:MAG: hypothetical protein DME26_04050 [Verrucomicrobia bacterium]|nr:MAG: hypothetical protein DME26_04050 [Verrucomicrobiota bacterium]